MERASADVGLMFTAYNLRRLITIIGKEGLTKYLRILVLWFFTKSAHIRATISHFNESFLSSIVNGYFTYRNANQLKFTLTQTLKGGY